MLSKIFGALCLLRTSGNGSNLLSSLFFILSPGMRVFPGPPIGRAANERPRGLGRVVDLGFDRGNPLMLIFGTVGRLRQKNKQRKKKNKHLAMVK